MKKFQKFDQNPIKIINYPIKFTLFPKLIKMQTRCSNKFAYKIVKYTECTNSWILCQDLYNLGNFLYFFVTSETKKSIIKAPNTIAI